MDKAQRRTPLLRMAIMARRVDRVVTASVREVVQVVVHLGTITTTVGAVPTVWSWSCSVRVAHACGKLLMARIAAQVPALARLKCKALTALDAPPRPLSRPAPSIMCKAPSLPSLSAGALGVPSSEVVPPA